MIWLNIASKAALGSLVRRCALRSLARRHRRREPTRKEWFSGSSKNIVLFNAIGSVVAESHGAGGLASTRIPMLAEPGLNRGRFTLEVNLASRRPAFKHRGSFGHRDVAIRRPEVAVSDTRCKPFGHSIELSLEPFQGVSVRRAVLGAPQALCEEELQPALMGVPHD